jgi:hypothetical protein
VCTRAYKTLLVAAGERSDAVIEEDAEVGTAVYTMRSS